MYIYRIIYHYISILECKCPCSFVGAVPIKSNETENLEQRIRELRSLLSVQKNMTTKARRQKVSTFCQDVGNSVLCGSYNDCYFCHCVHGFVFFYFYHLIKTAVNTPYACDLFACL